MEPCTVCLDDLLSAQNSPDGQRTAAMHGSSAERRQAGGHQPILSPYSSQLKRLTMRPRSNLHGQNHGLATNAGPDCVARSPIKTLPVRSPSAPSGPPPSPIALYRLTSDAYTGSAWRRSGRRASNSEDNPRVYCERTAHRSCGRFRAPPRIPSMIRIIGTWLQIVLCSGKCCKPDCPCLSTL